MQPEEAATAHDRATLHGPGHAVDCPCSESKRPVSRQKPPPVSLEDWDKLSDKRFSPGRFWETVATPSKSSRHLSRLSSTWDSMDAPSRRKYRGASVAAIEVGRRRKLHLPLLCLVCLQVYQQVAQWRLRMHALLKAA